MKKTLLMTITIAALPSLGATAIAGNHASEKTGSDMYVGIIVGKAKHNIKFNSAATAAIHDPDVTTMSLFVGMDLDKTFAIEGFYANHGESKFTGTTDTLKMSTMGIAAKAGTDLTDDLRGFVKVGFHSWKSESDVKDEGADVLYGLGVEYKLNENTAIFAGYDRFTYDNSNVVDMSIGIKYWF
jgi:OOP family OmpA-OmpF porin